MNLAMRVVSFCHYLQGPAATQYLADLGANVIKVEPVNGAFERHWSGGKSFVDGVSAFHLSVNRNKRSIAIDLKKSDALDVMMRIIDSSDVLVENFRPGVMDRLGLGYEKLKARKPDIIYASATGLGPDGPAARRPGQDLLMQARSGLMAATGNRTSGPTIVGAAVVDQHGASLLAMGILAAFTRKLQTGEGTRIEASLFQAAIDLQTEALTKYYASDASSNVMERSRNIGSWYHDAPYGAYALADCHIVLSMNDPNRLAEALDSETLRKLAHIDRYVERERYAEAVAAELAGLDFATVSRNFDTAGIWYERVQDYDELRLDPQVAHLGALTSVDVKGRPVTVVAHPIRYNGARPSVRAVPLQPGCNSGDILIEHGFCEEEINRLAATGVIGLPTDSDDGCWTNGKV